MARRAFLLGRVRIGFSRIRDTACERCTWNSGRHSPECPHVPKVSSPMQAPPTGLIEQAADEIVDVPQNIRAAQLKELLTFGDQRAKDIGASGVSGDFIRGYELGLQTMRVAISHLPPGPIAGAGEL